MNEQINPRKCSGPIRLKLIVHCTCRFFNNNNHHHHHLHHHLNLLYIQVHKLLANVFADEAFISFKNIAMKNITNHKKIYELSYQLLQNMHISTLNVILSKHKRKKIMIIIKCFFKLYFHSIQCTTTTTNVLLLFLSFLISLLFLHFLIKCSYFVINKILK